MNYQAIALDVDGTLIKEGSYKVSPRVKEALRSAEKKVPIIFCTGRSLSEMSPMIEDLGIRRQYMVLGGGSEIFCPLGNLIHSSSIEPETFDNFKNNFAEDNLKFYFQANNRWCNEFTTPIRAFGFIINGEVRSNQYFEKARLHSQGLHISMASDSSAADNFIIYATAANTCKGNGLRYVLDKLNIPLHNTIAVGDMYNDIPMLKLVGLPIAMGQAPEKVKSIAKHITSHVDDDGAAEVIEQFILN